MKLVYEQILSDKATLKIYQGVCKNIFTLFLLMLCKIKGHSRYSYKYGLLKILSPHMHYKIFYKKSFKIFKIFKLKFNKKINNNHFYFSNVFDGFVGLRPTMLFPRLCKLFGVGLKALTDDLDAIITEYNSINPKIQCDTIMDIIIHHSHDTLIEYEKSIISEYDMLNTDLLLNRQTITKQHNIDTF